MEMFTYPNCRESIWLAVLFVLWVIVAQIICIIAGVPSHLCSVLTFGSIAIALAIAFRAKVMDRSILRYKKIKTKTLLFAIGSTLCIPWLHSLFFSMLPFSDVLTRMFKEFADKTSETAYIFYIISAILLPFIMEIIFRGIILRGLLTEYKPWKSILIAAFIYAMVWGCMTLLPLLGLIYGLWFGWLYVYSRSLWTSILSFISVQLTSVVYSIICLNIKPSPSVESIMTGESWMANLAMSILFCILTYFLYQTFKHDEN